MGWYEDIPSGNFQQFANLNMAIEIVSFPMNSMVMFHSFLANVYQRVHDFSCINPYRALRLAMPDEAT